MKKLSFIPILLLVLALSLLGYQFFLKGKLPIPADTIVGLYYPYRDIYAATNPNGIAYHNPLITDPVRQQYPWRFLSIALEKQFELPLWNPYNFAGNPLLANMQSAPFYPLNFLLVIFPFQIGWSILVLLQPILAGLFLYLYLRKMKLTQSASFLAGICFALCGFNTAWLEWNTIGHTLLWLPLILLAKEHLLKKMTWQWILVFVFAECSAILAGHLQTLFYSIVLSNLYLTGRIIQISIKQHSRQTYIVPAIKKYIPFIILGGCIFALTAIQWLPTIQLINQSARNIDQQDWHKMGWFIPEQQLVQFISPDFFGNPATNNYWGVWNYGEFVGYIGVIPLIFALFALFYRRDKKTAFFGTIFFFSLLFALDTWLGQLPFLLKIPFISTSQPTRLLALTDFSLAILAGLGLDFFVKTDQKRQIMKPIYFLSSILASLWIYTIIGHKLFAIKGQDLLTARHNLYFPSILFLGGIVLITAYIFTQHKKIKYLNISIVIIFLLITIIDLLRFSVKFNTFSIQAYLYPPTKSFTYLQNQTGIFRVMKTTDTISLPNFSIMYHIQTLDGYDPLYLLRYGELMAAVARQKPDISGPFGFNRSITPQTYQSRLIDLMNVKYVLSLTDLNNPKLKKVLTDGQTKVYENSQAFPRAFFVNSVLPVTTKQQNINALFDNSINLKQTATVENWNTPQTSFTTGDVSITQYKENTIQLNTKNKNTGFLVLTDSFYPTWHAEICEKDTNNCKTTHIYLTDYNFRGIIVPAGEYRILFYTTLL
jgi:hypothetical protein